MKSKAVRLYKAKSKLYYYLYLGHASGIPKAPLFYTHNEISRKRYPFGCDKPDFEKCK